MKLTFQAMKGSLGGRTYYSTLMPLSAVPKVLDFADAELGTADREQRKLNTKRIPDISDYIKLNDGEGYVFSSITASHKKGVQFLPRSEDGALGLLEVDLGEASFLINDGQHRAAAISMALQAVPSLGDDTISVLLFPYENKARAQQMFSDLNRYVKKTSKSLDILFDHRDVYAQVTRDIAEQVPAFQDLVEVETTSLSASSTKLFTLAALHDANEELLKDRNTDEVTRNELSAMAVEYWLGVSRAISDWGRVKRGDITPRDFRMENISSHSVVLRALGAVGAELIKQFPDDWKDRLQTLRSIDWRKSNPDWDNVCIVANSVVSNRQARAATKAYLKERLGLALTEAEQRAIVRPSIPKVA
jgi:DNA sulfur modification protein DndB